jgi:hypothetical protein
VVVGEKKQFFFSVTSNSPFHFLPLNIQLSQALSCFELKNNNKNQIQSVWWGLPVQRCQKSTFGAITI